MRTAVIVALIGANLVAILASNVGLKLSATAGTWRVFLAWQIFGNLTGFLGVLCFTALLRLVPMNVGFGITAGLGYVLVQVVGARVFFRETVLPLQWLGAALVVVGVGLIAFGSKG